MLTVSVSRNDIFKDHQSSVMIVPGTLLVPRSESHPMSAIEEDMDIMGSNMVDSAG